MKLRILVLVIFLSLHCVLSVQERETNSNPVDKLRTRLRSLRNVNSTRFTERNFLNYLLNKLTALDIVDRIQSFFEKLKFWTSSEEEEGSGLFDGSGLRSDSSGASGESSGMEEDEDYIDFQAVLTYFGLDSLLPTHDFIMYLLQNAGNIPYMMDVMDGLLQDALDELPLVVINELVELVPWTTIDNFLATAEETSVSKLKDLVFAFKPFVGKVLELYEFYYGTDESVVVLLKSALSRRLAKLGAEGSRSCSGKKVVCYYPNWAYYRKGLGHYVADDIDTSLCTHFIYAFAVLDGENHVMKAHDNWLDLDRSGGFRGWNKGFFRKFTDLKKKNPNAKYLLALGGWNDSTKRKYSELLADPAKIARFVEHSLSFVTEYGFDGLDLDYEYPNYDGHGHDAPESDRPGFTQLCQKLSEAFKPLGLELTAAVSASENVTKAGYDVPQVCSYLDSVHVMAYDLHGQWEKNVNHASPLYGEDWDMLTVDHGINVWVDMGCPREKLILGIPTYGRSWTLGSWAEPEISYEINSTALSGGQPGPHTRAKGFLAYHEICDFVQNHGWTKVSDPQLRTGPYAYHGNQWVSYDDIEMVRVKANYINNQGFGGAMFWDLSTDDFNNVCGDGKSPLITTVSQIVKSQTSCSAPRH